MQYTRKNTIVIQGFFLDFLIISVFDTVKNILEKKKNRKSWLPVFSLWFPMARDKPKLDGTDFSIGLFQFKAMQDISFNR